MATANPMTMPGFTAPAVAPILEPTELLAQRLGINMNSPLTSVRPIGNPGLAGQMGTNLFYQEMQPLYGQVQGVPRTLTERLANRGILPGDMSGRLAAGERGSVSMPNPGLGRVAPNLAGGASTARGASSAANFLSNLGVAPGTGAPTPGAAASAGGAGASGGAASAAGAAPRTGMRALTRGFGQGAGLGARAGAGLTGYTLGSMAGDVASNRFGSDTGAGNFLEGALRGGGAGMAFGPKGAAVGAILGGLGNLVGGGDVPLLSSGEGQAAAVEDPDATLDELFGVAGLDPDTQESIRSQYQIFTTLNGNSDEARQAALMGAGEQIMQAIATQPAEQAAMQEALATQAIANQYMQPIIQQMGDTANLRSQVTQSLIPQLPEAYRGLAQLSAAQGQDRAAATMAAYQGQIAAMPAIQSLESQMAYQDQLNSQLQSQAIGAQVGSQGGSGGTDLASLLGAAPTQ